MYTMFGQCIKMIKESEDMTMKEMAEELGCSPAYLYDLCNGEKPITPHLINVIINLFNLNKHDREKIYEAARLSKESVKVNLKGKRPDQIKTLFSLIDNLDNLDYKDSCAIQKYLIDLNNKKRKYNNNSQGETENELRGN